MISLLYLLSNLSTPNFTAINKKSLLLLLKKMLSVLIFSYKGIASVLNKPIQLVIAVGLFRSIYSDIMKKFKYNITERY